MKISVRRFFGQVPKLDRHVIPDGNATLCVNADLRSAILSPLRQPRLFRKFADLGAGIVRTNAQRVFGLIQPVTGNRIWLMFQDPETQIARSPNINDQFERVYWSAADNNGPAYSTLSNIAANGAVYTLGVPKGPDFTVTTSGGSGATVTRVYVATYYTDFGEEGPPGDPVVVTGKVDGTWLVDDYPTTQPAGPNRLNGVRFYRATQADAVFRFLRNVNFGGLTSFNDTVAETDLVLRIQLDSFDNQAPPSTLKGILGHPDGFLVGFMGRDVYFSKPFVPHAWPPSLTVRVEYQIVAIAIFGETIAVLTKGPPVLLTGTTPLTMEPIRFDDPVPCIAARSVIVYQQSVLYAAPDGLARLGFDGPQIITAPIIDREDWLRDWQSSVMKSVLWDANYLTLTSPSTGFLLAIDAPLYGFDRVQLPVSFASLDVIHDDGNIVFNRQGDLFEWMSVIATPNLLMSWISKTWLMPEPVNMGAYQIKQTDEIIDVTMIDPLLQQKLDFNTLRYSRPEVDVVNGYAVNEIADVEILFGPYVPPPPGAGEPTPAVPPAIDFLPPGQPIGGGHLMDVVTTSGPFVRTRIIANDMPIYDQVTGDERTKRLPSGFKATRWSFELHTNKKIVTVGIAGTGRELRELS